MSDSIVKIPVADDLDGLILSSLMSLVWCTRIEDQKPVIYTDAVIRIMAYMREYVECHMKETGRDSIAIMADVPFNDYKKWMQSYLEKCVHDFRGVNFGSNELDSFATYKRNSFLSIPPADSFVKMLNHGGTHWLDWDHYRCYNMTTGARYSLYSYFVRSKNFSLKDKDCLEISSKISSLTSPTQEFSFWERYGETVERELVYTLDVYNPLSKKQIAFLRPLWLYIGKILSDKYLPIKDKKFEVLAIDGIHHANALVTFQHVEEALIQIELEFPVLKKERLPE